MKRSLLIFVIFGVMILSLSCVSASENNDTLIQHDCSDSMDISSENLKLVTSDADFNQVDEYVDNENIVGEDYGINKLSDDVDENPVKSESKNVLKLDGGLHIYGPNLNGLQGHSMILLQGQPLIFIMILTPLRIS